MRRLSSLFATLLLMLPGIARAGGIADQIDLAVTVAKPVAVVYDARAILKAERRARHDCALTFDDGPARFTDQLLDTLNTKGLKATFFVVGKMAAAKPGIVRRMLAEGHQVENHSYSHPDFRKLDTAAQTREIDDTTAVLRDLGANPTFFRPPYGAYTKDTATIAQSAGLIVMLWSIDSVDWRFRDAAKIEETILAKNQPAEGVYLFHDIHETTVNAMPAVIDKLAEQNCRFVTLGNWYRTATAPAPLDPTIPTLTRTAAQPVPATLAQQ